MTNDETPNPGPAPAPPAEVFTTADALPVPEPKAPPGPAEQADAEAAKDTEDEARPRASGEAVEDDANAGFVLDETPEEKERRQARERKQRQRKRQAFEEWQARKAASKADGRFVVTDPLAGMTEDDWRRAERDPDPRNLMVSVLTRTGRLTYEPGFNGQQDVYRMAKLLAMEYDLATDLGCDGTELVERLAALKPGQTLMLPGGDEWLAKEVAGQAAEHEALRAKAAASAGQQAEEYPETAQAQAEHEQRMRKLHGGDWNPHSPNDSPSRFGQ